MAIGVTFCRSGVSEEMKVALTDTSKYRCKGKTCGGARKSMLGRCGGLGQRLWFKSRAGGTVV